MHSIFSSRDNLSEGWLAGLSGVDNRSEWSPIKYRDVHVPGPAMELLVVCSVGNGVHIAGSAAAKPSTTLALTKQRKHHCWRMVDLDPGRVRPLLPVSGLDIRAPASVLHCLSLTRSIESRVSFHCSLPLLSSTADYRHAATLTLTAPYLFA
jgi:hypothetical protein